MKNLQRNFQNLKYDGQFIFSNERADERTGQSPVEKKSTNQSDGPLSQGRRDILKALFTGLTLSALPSSLSLPEAEVQEMEALKKLPEIIEQVDKEHPNAEPLEKVQIALNMAAAVNFTAGVAELAEGKPISVGSNQVLYSLLSAKYYFSNPEQRKHLEHEFLLNAKMTAFVSAMVTASDGFKSDEIEARYKEELEAKEEKLDDKRRVVLAMLLSACLSPVATTLGSSGATKGVAHDLVKNVGNGDTEKKIKSEHF